MNTLTPTDVYAIVNAAAKAMYGGNTAIQATNTSSFVSVGEAMLRTGYENTLDALSIMIARTFFAVRPYTGTLKLMNVTRDQFGGIRRKISYFYDEAEQSQDWNTDKAATQLNDGQSIDHYKIRKRYPLEMNFCGLKVLQKHVTRFDYQIKRAFQSEADFDAYYRGLAIEIGNELEMMVEAENRLHLLNHIAGVYDVGSARMKVNLTKGFNTKFGTSYTSVQLRTEHLKEFLAYFVAETKNVAALMRQNNTLFHLTPVKNNDAGNPLVLLRHTPYQNQKMFLYAPLFRDAEAMVLPEIFNDQYLSISNYEGVEFWQDVAAPASISVTPNVLDVTTGQSKNGTAVSLDYVVGILFDEDALATNYYVDRVKTTPENAAGSYYNTFYHWAKQYDDDFTENSVIFYMADGEE